MEGFPIYQVQSQLARDLKDLVGVQFDLARVVTFLRRCQTESDSTILDGLYTAALITYRRCFTNGMRTRVTEAEVAAVAPGAIDVHRHILAQADKLAAHAVNPFEQVQIGAAVANGEVIGIGNAILRQVLIGPEGLNSFGVVCELLMSNYINPRIEKLRAELLNEVRARPIRDIERGDEMGFTAPHPDQARQRRER